MLGEREGERAMISVSQSLRKRAMNILRITVYVALDDLKINVIVVFNRRFVLGLIH